MVIQVTKIGQSQTLFFFKSLRSWGERREAAAMSQKERSTSLFVFHMEMWFAESFKELKTLPPVT